MAQVLGLKAARALLGTIALMGLMLMPPAAWAHHAMGGKLPSNVGEGFLAGLAHPVVGLDHLAFVIAIGLLAAGYRQGWQLPTVFVIAAMGGTGIHVGRFNLPIVEGVVAISVVTLGLLLALNLQPNWLILAGLAAGAGLFHGYAYGESIVGAEAAPLGAYLAGFSLIQWTIALLFCQLGRFWRRSLATRQPQRWGYGLTAIGLVFLAQTILN
jgi:urease accessory protein